MNFLIIDTETTTFPNSNLPASHPQQAQVIQLAALQLDQEFKEIASLYSLIKLRPGKVISEGAFKAHGIRADECSKGREGKEVIEEFMQMGSQCDYLIAHNIVFDKKMLELELSLLDKSLCGEAIEICTMELMTNICKLPFASRRTFGQKYKWPKLEEVYRHCFNESIVGAHDAINDVRATARIFKWLIDNKYVVINSVA